jgi:hypothetical protein
LLALAKNRLRGLLMSGPSNEVMKLPLTIFKGFISTNTAPRTVQRRRSVRAHVTITDTAHDILTLNNVTSSMLSRHAGNVFKSV